MALATETEYDIELSKSSPDLVLKFKIHLIYPINQKE